MLKKEWDVSQGQIAAAVRSNIKIKNQRRSTVNNLGKASKMEEMMENAGKKVLRGLMFKKGTSKELEDLEKQYEEAEKRRSQTKLELQMADEYDDDIEDIEDTLESNGES
jgi:predicted ribosome quality control (RQC) complex YloA/Tae2 family protein